MRVWRLARGVYPPLDGEGVRRFGGRWNPPGLAVTYTAGSLALAVLEVLVHVELEELPEDLTAFEIDVPEDLLIETVEEAALPADWQRIEGHPGCEAMGQVWVEGSRSAVLRVPSVVVRPAWNYLINPAHKEARRVTIASSSPFRFDARLRVFR